MTFPLESTIAALGTPPGRSAVALVRMSGPEALRILLRLCPEITDAEPLPRRQHLLIVRHPETRERIDRALVTFFRGPRSYTGEDSVELSTHGGLLTPQLVLDALYAAGARPAQPGEFTYRAVLNGRLDILQAEAVLDLIDGRSPAMHRAAVFQMERGLSRLISELRAGILQVEALVAYSIDFPEEDEPPVPQERVTDATHSLLARVDHLLRTAPQGEMLREGALVVLAGRPNSGKSSLFNGLLGTERVLVSDIPGTTRDAVEAAVIIEGYPFRLVDTAGLRDTEDRVEGMGIEVARRYLAAADLILFCAEAGRSLDPTESDFLEALPAGRALLIRTKSDLAVDEDPEPPESGSEVRVSTLATSGLSAVRSSLLAAAYGGILGDPGEAPLVTRGRHARALRAARGELLLFLDGLATGVPAEVSATHLRGAGAALEDLIGAIVPDDVLGAVFADFCVGK